MRLSELRLEHFRGFEDTTIELNDYSCFVGPNGAGKSTVLAALNVFFREPLGGRSEVGVLTDEDFHLKDTSRPVRITLVFEGLSLPAQEAFKTYFRHDRLIVSAEATWDEKASRANVRHVGSRLAGPIHEADRAASLAA